MAAVQTIAIRTTNCQQHDMSVVTDSGRWLSMAAGLLTIGTGVTTVRESAQA